MHPVITVNLSQHLWWGNGALRLFEAIADILNHHFVEHFETTSRTAAGPSYRFRHQVEKKFLFKL